ncbi:hypothetical protein [uncultured Aquimarina sp.]|uniref:hypothetical protein n=1 Tax=uncultured Aquimarina sp. TaxID=575652 RepID=UPI00260AE205|nr:hypothetical protein [uncultured Aquimarina sp.]
MMSTPITIPKEVPSNSALSYDFLREEGIKTIQELAGTSWTDHNTHDPGITILEQLCYAITDLAYRLDYDIQDLLGDNLAAHQELYSAATILSSSAVTWLDLRKVVIDIKGVKNAWIEKITPENIISVSNSHPTPKGLYTVIIEKDDLIDAEGNMLQTIKKRLLECRSLCEDFEDIQLLDKQKIRLGGTIEISNQTDDIHLLIADLLYKIQEHLSPSIRFYTLQELLDKGKRTDEVFEGPILDHGFIDDDELEEQIRKTEIHASDLIKEIMDVGHVVTVQDLLIQSGANDGKNWVYYLDTTKTPTLDINATLQSLQFRVQGLTATINTEQVLKNYQQKVLMSATQKNLNPVQKEMSFSVGKDRNIANYYSVQNQFPDNYGIGTLGLPDSLTDKRKAQAKQLKAYLTFFDQLLANTFSKVANFQKLVSFTDLDYRTYFNQSLLGVVEGLEDILVSKEDYETYLTNVSSITLESLQRKNKFLNHLLARFSETFSTHVLGEPKEGTDVLDQEQRLIQDKMQFLQSYPLISANRGKGFDYSKPHTNDTNYSGLEKRIALKLGLEEQETFFMVEHLLLRPKTTDQHTLETYYQSIEITAFKAAENELNTECIIPEHSFLKGEQIRITQNGTYDGIHMIQSITETGFEINTPFQEGGSNDTANCQRIQPDIKHHLFSEPITSFEASPNTGHTFCNTIHSLQIGDAVTIVGAEEYDGTHKVTNITETSFEIEIPFNQVYITGRFMQLDTTEDLYSLQLSFVFPEGKGRYQDPVFQNFVENTVREETPVHLTTYVHWLGADEIEMFTKAYQDFVVTINKR